MKTLQINDLDYSDEIDESSMSAVSGGMNFGVQGPQAAPVGVLGGGFFSPQIVTSVPVNVPVSVQLDLDTALDLENRIGTVVASAASTTGV
jgi:hypothetical protein